MLDRYENTTTQHEISERGYSFTSGETVKEMIGSPQDLQGLFDFWNDLGSDNYLQGDYIFRHRRYGQLSFTPATREFDILPQAAYEQTSEINSYAGGIQRHFDPVTDEILNNNSFRSLIASSFDMFNVPDTYRDSCWTVQVHMFRLSAQGPRETHPTPEGIHRDGVPMGALHMIGRQRIEGGVSHIYTPEEELLDISTLTSPLDSFYAWDNRVLHYATPLFASEMHEGHRDVLVYGFHLEGTEYARA